MTVGRKRLVDYLAALDAARFVGRSQILAPVEGMLAGSDPRRVVLVHGTGGIGKSALIREIGRRAEALGRNLHAIDARALEPVPGELETVLEAATDRSGVVVTIDAFEHVRALDSLLRERILPSLPADALVVVASREPPGPGWFAAGWEHVVWDVPLGPLRADEALDFLMIRGVSDPDIAAALVEWSGGSPLALNLAVSGAPSDPLELDGGDLHRVIVRRLAGDELDAIDNEVLEVAALARAVDSRLLAAVLPGRPTRAANEVLSGCSVAEQVGGRVTLHDLVRSSLRDDLRRRDRPRYDRLRRTIADHLLARASAGEVRLLSDLLELIDDPQVRWGIGGHAHARFRIDPWRPEDADVLRDLFLEERDGDPRWWDEVAYLLAHAPEMGLVARDLDGAPAAFSVATSVADAPAVAEEDRILALLLADARARAADKEHTAGASSTVGQAGTAGPIPSQAMIFRDGWRRPGPTGEAALGVMNLAAVLRSDLPNVSRSYILDTVPGADEAQAFFRAVGAVREPDLDPQIAGRGVPCWVIDHGPEGMLGQIRDVIYAEADSSGDPSAGAPRRQERDLQRAAFDALRDFNRLDLMEASELLDHVASSTDGQRHRVERFRGTIVRAVEASFGQTPSDRLLHDVVSLGDLDPTVTHEQAMIRLSVSRATYFRQLRKARERVAAVLLEQLSAVD